MRISFIVPAYNEEKLLGRCLDSINDEIARCPWITASEVLVVDNQSTDSTFDVSHEHGARTIVCIVKGLTRARQKGMEQAMFDVQAYIDADNFLPKGWLNSAWMIEDPEVAAITGPVYYFEQGRLLRAGAWLFYGLALLSHRLIGPSIQGGNFILKRSLLKKVGGHSTDILFYGEDTDLAKRVSAVGKVKQVPRMWIYSSDRRLVAEGVFRAVWRYTLNYFTVSILGRPVTEEYRDIR